MNPYLDDGDQRLYHGDCIEVMPTLGLVDAIICDPPYGLGFMGKDWDSPGGTGDFPMRRTTEANTVNTGVTRQGGRQRSCSDFARRQARDARGFQEWCESWAIVALDVLKPGGHLVAFGGTRTYHRLACALEDAGFEIRDCLTWLYGSGFPKSLDVAKAVDGQRGVDTGSDEPWKPTPHFITGAMKTASGNSEQIGQARPGERHLYDPETDEARRWHGWGTALKPAWEPIILARKPLTGTVAGNVLAYDTGALNIDECRIGTGDENDLRAPQSDPSKRAGVVGTDLGISNADVDRFRQAQRDSIERTNTLGRWPANVVLDETAAAMLDEQSGGSTSTGGQASLGAFRVGDVYGKGRDERERRDPGLGGSGGASRFFYTAKASRSERNDGIHGQDEYDHSGPRGHTLNGDGSPRPRPRGNTHPTVKPVALMRWLVRLVTPPGGVVLDPFVGSGSTLVACRVEGVRGVGIDRELDYIKIAAGRLSQLSLLVDDG